VLAVWRIQARAVDSETSFDQEHKPVAEEFKTRAQSSSVLREISPLGEGAAQHARWCKEGELASLVGAHVVC
jgi:hypothetical protein